MDPKDKKEILDAIRAVADATVANTKDIKSFSQEIIASEKRTHQYITEAVDSLARMTQVQFGHMAADMDEIKSDMKEVKTRLTNLEHRGNGQDNLIAKNTDDIRLLKTKVGIA